MNKWIKFKDQKPPVNVNVLVYTDKNEIRIMWAAPSGNCFLGSAFETVWGKPEYWMPLPEAPEKEFEESVKEVMDQYSGAIKNLGNK